MFIQVVNADVKDVQLKYMKEVSDGIFTWPAKDDESWETKDKIICKIHCPQVLPGRRTKIKFSTKDLDKCKVKVKHMNSQ